MIYNDALGAGMSFIANLLGWAALMVIIGAGFWQAALYLIRQSRVIAASAKRAWKEAIG